VHSRVTPANIADSAEVGRAKPNQRNQQKQQEHFCSRDCCESMRCKQNGRGQEQEVVTREKSESGSDTKHREREPTYPHKTSWLRWRSPKQHGGSMEPHPVQRTHLAVPQGMLNERVTRVEAAPLPDLLPIRIERASAPEPRYDCAARRSKPC